MDGVNRLDIDCAEGAARKRLVMSQSRYEGACNRIADANVTFCERGGTVKRVTDFLCKKIGTSVTCSDMSLHSIIDTILRS